MLPQELERGTRKRDGINFEDAIYDRMPAKKAECAIGLVLKAEIWAVMTEN